MCVCNAQKVGGKGAGIKSVEKWGKDYYVISQI